jgi:hypothetical protein
MTVVLIVMSGMNPHMISCDLGLDVIFFKERKTKFNLEMSRTTQMQLYKCIHVP